MISRLWKTALAAVLLAGVLLPAAAQADVITVYTSYSDYTAALVSYDLFSHPSTVVLGPGANGFGATVTDSSGFYPSEGVDLTGNVSGTTEFSPYNSGDTLLFSQFDGTPNAFGGFFYPCDVYSDLTAGSINIDVNGQQFTVTTPATDTVPFYGFIDYTGPITSVSDQSGNISEYFPTADQIVIGSASVPEPSSVALALGLLAPTIFRRRRRNARRAQRLMRQPLSL